MNLHPESCYQAICAGDPRFDGVFYVGVASTGIYCRTVCPARTPKRENCRYFPSAAAAEVAGHRPCLRCRPELAPGSAPIDAVGRLAAAALGRIEDGALNEGSVDDLAADLGVTGRHLRRVVQGEYGVSPVELAQTQRLLLAKRLLTDTALPVTEVAFASGFASLRRFNHLFKERYRLNPTDFRRLPKGGSAAPGDSIRCEIAYRPPFAWRELLAFLGNRAAPGVELVEADRYARTFAWKGCAGWVAVSPSAKPNALSVEIAPSLVRAIPPVLARVRRLFDLAAEPRLVAAHLGPLAEGCPGIRVPGAFDGFEMALRAVLGQQVSVAAAATLYGRLALAFGEAVETPVPQLSRLAPAAERLARAERDEIARLGIIGSRAVTIRALAAAVAGGEIRLEPTGDPGPVMERLCRLPGIGEWTAQYIAMRALSWPDALPEGDLVLRRALGDVTAKELRALAEPWRPWRSYAVMHVWARGSGARGLGGSGARGLGGSGAPPAARTTPIGHPAAGDPGLRLGD